MFTLCVYSKATDFVLPQKILLHEELINHIELLLHTITLIFYTFSFTTVTFEDAIPFPSRSCQGERV